MKSILKTTETLDIRDCGLADYRQVLKRQKQLHEKRQKAQIPNTVLIVEHPAVITLGARQSANKLLVTPEELARRNIDLVQIRRGGGVTAHNPGQLVFYPILDLRTLGLGINEYIRKLEAIGIELLAQLGVEARRQKGIPGLWVENRQDPDEQELTPQGKRIKSNSALFANSSVKEKRNTQYAIHNTRKIASIGVRVSKFITYHGMAINIQNDLSIFDSIIPCGLDNVKITSVINETAKRHSIDQVKEKLYQLLIKHLSTGHSSPHTIERNTQYATRNTTGKLPSWLRRPLSADESFIHTEHVLNSLNLQTICFSANCPNRGQCWAKGTATVLILGGICTRNCKFCSVPAGKPAPPDQTEPARIAEMAKKLALKYLVITSVDRDDLPDGGAGHFRDCINEVRRQCPETKFEILTPDFHNCQTDALKILRGALPFVFAHNVETVPSLYPLARAGGNYQRSLDLLRLAKETYDNVLTKSSIMLGLGETDAEVEQTLKDLRSVACNRITIGQYLKPSKNSLDVVQYIPPEKFDFWKQKAFQLGFSWVCSSPFARSSYLAEQKNPC